MNGYQCPACRREDNRGAYVELSAASRPVDDPFGLEVRMAAQRPDTPWVASCPFGHRYLVRSWTQRLNADDDYDLERIADSGPVPDERGAGA